MSNLLREKLADLVIDGIDKVHDMDVTFAEYIFYALAGFFLWFTTACVVSFIARESLSTKTPSLDALRIIILIGLIIATIRSFRLIKKNKV